MATSLNVIRTLTLRAVATGFEAAASAARGLAGAQDQVAASSANQTKSTLSADAALQKLQRRYDQEARAQQDLAKAQQTLERARSQGLISAAEQNRLMALAVTHHNGAASAAGKHSQALQELSTISQGLSGNLGTVGGILARMGPAGLAIAAGIGATVGIFAAASVAALKFAEDMGKLADTAETVGLAVEQLRALQMAAGEVGVSSEQLDTNLTKFTSVLGQVRDGSQSAYDSFNRLGAGLGDSVRSAKNEEQALNLVFEALRKADTASAALGARELFCKSGSGMVRLANATTTLDNLAKSMNALDVITGAQAKSWDDLGDRINKNMALAGANVKASFATPVLEALAEVSKVIVELSRTFRLIGTDALGNLNTSPIEKFRVELQLLNLEIQTFGALKALDNLAERLGLGANFASNVAAVINTIKLLASALLDLINIIASVSSAMGRFVVFDFSGALAQVNSARASFANLGQTVVGLKNNFQTVSDASTEMADENKALVKQLGENNKQWLSFGNQMEKIGEITPPVSAKINDLGKANALAAKKTKEHKEEVSDLLKELGQVASQLTSSLVGAFLKGDNAAKALKGTLQSIASSSAGKAVDKLVTGDFTGAAISGAISVGSAIASFLFGNDEDEKKQQEAQKAAAEAAAAAAAALKQAQDAFAGLTRQIADFNALATGTVISDLTKSLADLEDQANQFMNTAAAAHDDAAVQNIGNTAVAGIIRLLTQFLRDVPDLIAEFGTGTTVMADAKQAVRDLMGNFRSLDDAILEFGRRTGDTVGTLERHTQLLNQYFEALLKTLDAPVTLSETATEFKRLNATAEELTVALVDLGFTAEQAADIVDTKLNAALGRLAGNFLDPLIREINAFVGADWINQATDLFARVSQLNADAATLGIKTTLIQTFFVLAAQDIINKNQLVGFSFQALVNMLGLADAGLHEFTNSVEDAAATLVRSAQEIASAIQTNEDRLFNAIHRSDSLADQLARFDLQAQREREAEIAAGGQALASLEAAIQQERLNLINDFLQQQLDAQQQANDQSAQEAERVRQEQIQAAQQAAEERARAMQEAVDFIQGQVRNIQEWVNNFLAGQQSILPPSQQMATARAHFASEYALAQSGNRDALSNITNSAQQVVDSVRRYFGSSTAGQTIIQQLLGSLGTLPSLLSPEEFIVENLTPPIDNVSTTVTTTTSTQTATLAALLNNLRLAVQANDPQAIAIALLPLFDGIDTSGDQALSFNELVAALGSTFSTGTLQSIFQELDTNGDQLLQKSELIRQAAQSTAVEVTPVGDIENNTDAAKNLLQTTADRIAQGTAETSLWLSQIWNTLVTTIHNDLQQMISWLGWLGVIAGWAPGSSHAAGGYITGGIPGRDSVHAMLTPGEFVVRQPVARMYPWLENFNATGMLPGVMSMGAAANDNSVVVALSRLERSLLRGFKAMIETQLQAAGIVAEPMREANKLTRTRRGEKKVA
jgi:hypothetical protein